MTIAIPLVATLLFFYYLPLFLLSPVVAATAPLLIACPFWVDAAIGLALAVAVTVSTRRGGVR